MNKNTVNTNYGRLTDDELSVFAGKVLSCLTGNLNFTFPEGKLGELGTNGELFTHDLIKSKTGSQADTLAKNLSRDALLETLSFCANEVNIQANGDLIKLFSIGPTKSVASGLCVHKSAIVIGTFRWVRFVGRFAYPLFPRSGVNVGNNV